jgi:hypothetical protein
MPKRVQIQSWRKPGGKKPANVVIVARPSPYGNYAGPTRADFERDIAEMSNADRAFFMDRVAELRGKDLACWCRLDQPCHADVLLNLANMAEAQP